MYQYLRLCAVVEPRAGGQPVPRVPAPIIRRVLGKALVESFCTFGKPVCQQVQGPGLGGRLRALPCSLAASCPYGVLYAGSLNDRPPFAVHVGEAEVAPPAAVVEATVFGPAWQLYGWLLAGLGQAMARGVGRERTPWRLQQVLRVHADGREERLCGADLAELPPRLSPDELSLATGGQAPSGPVEVELLSPLRLVQDGSVVCDEAPVPFYLLIARILDRVAGVFGRGDAGQDRARAELRAAAASVGLLEHHIRWVEVNDYSARQGSRMTLGGKVGRLLYDEAAAAFLPVLRAGEVLHVGKNPTSGCGRIRVVPRPPRTAGG